MHPWVIGPQLIQISKNSQPRCVWGCLAQGTLASLHKKEQIMAFNNKYDPKTLDDLVIDKNNLQILRLMTSQLIKDHLLLEGANGTGKSTITDLLPKLTHGQNYQVENIKAHEDFVIDKDVLLCWENFCGLARAQGDAAYIVIDEIDTIKKNHALFWQWLDTRRGTVTVIGTTNRLMAVPKAMRSRMKCLTFKPVKTIAMLPRAREIMKAENLVVNDNYLLSELTAVQSFGDIRKYMERLELVAVALRMGAIDSQGYQVAPSPRLLTRVK